MYIDTHAHLNFEAFKDDWQKLVIKAKKNGVKKIIVVGTDLISSKRAVRLAEETEGLFATVGFHPHHCKGLTDKDKVLEEIKKLSKHKKVVAIGECGLDYHEYRKTKHKKTQITNEQKNLQKQVFGQQIQLAKSLGLPLVIHNREAQKEILDVIDHFSKNDGKYPKGVFHCIAGSVKYLEKVLEKGFFIGVDGNVTYNLEVQVLVKELPLERLLIETDSPFLIPEPLRSQRKVPNRLSLKLQTAGGSEPRLRNQPVNVTIVAEYIAKLKNVSLDKVKASSTKNAEALFSLKARPRR